MNSFALRRVSLSSLTVHPLSHELFGQLSEEEFAALKADIATRGLQYPPEVDRWGRIICGSQRFRAAQELGWTEMDVFDRTELETEDQVREHLIRDNLHRRHLTNLQRFYAGQALEEIEAHKAAERQKTLGRTHGTDPFVSQDAKGGDTGRTDETVAKEVGWSGSTYRRMKKVVESGDEDLIGQVDRGEIGIAVAASIVAPPRHKAQPLGPDDVRVPALRVARWEYQMERFLHFLEIHPPSQFHPLEGVVCATLEKAEERLRTLRQTISLPGGNGSPSPADAMAAG